MPAKFVLLFAFCAAVMAGEDCGPLPSIPHAFPNLTLTLTSTPEPVITINSSGAGPINYGFEGGTVVKMHGVYDLFTTEMTSPGFLRTRLGLWKSADAHHWTRMQSLFESSGNFDGSDQRAVLWSPMPIFDRKFNVWNLFYVAYRSKPDVGGAWYGNYDGVIWRALSVSPGINRIDGPYENVGVVLSPGPKSDPWEGLQGTDSFYPYQAFGRWFAFYGTAQTQRRPIRSWQVGLASAEFLAGPWKRCSALNPVPLQKTFVENPVVSRVDNNLIAIYDVDVEQPNAIGYAVSPDGVHWAKGKQLIIFPNRGATARTPLALIPEAGGVYSLFLTAMSQVKADRLSGQPVNAGSVYLANIRIEKH